MAAEDDDVDLLEQMLLQADEVEKEKKIKEKKFFADSSDEEDQKESTSKYNEFGQGINKIFKQNEEAKKYNSIRLNERNDNQPGTSRSFQSIPPAPIQKQSATHETVFCDPIFGLRIINPAISSVTFKQRMQDKIPVGVQRARFHTERGDLSKDWVIAGVIVTKSPVKTTQKGDPFSIWSISDLRGEMKTVSVFLFRSAHQELWKTSTSSVVAILNPKTLERKDDKVEAVLSVDNSQKVMILGQSKDLGSCKSRKNNGEVCGALVNKTDCDVCIFHMKKEYSKIKRSELQSSGLGRGLQELRNKVLGKSEVFYAGQSFTAQKKPAAKPVKQMKKDRERLMTLSEYYTSGYNPDAPSPTITREATTASPGLIKRAATIDPSNSQRKKDIERLKLLQGTDKPEIILTPKFEREKPTATPATPPAPALKNDPSFVPKLRSENLTFSFSVPRLKCGNKNEIAKQRAAAILKKKPLEISNPNLIKYRGTEVGKKRIAEELNSSSENIEKDSKKIKLAEEEEAKKKKEYLQRIMNAKSSHEELVEDMQREKEQKTFDRLEKKEAMEEKMASTMEVKVR